jgi:hypothetical protein
VLAPVLAMAMAVTEPATVLAATQLSRGIGPSHLPPPASSPLTGLVAASMLSWPSLLMSSVIRTSRMEMCHLTTRMSSSSWWTTLSNQLPSPRFILHPVWSVSKVGGRPSSKYECLRLRNMERNKAGLVTFGLLVPLAPPKVT